MSVHLGETRNLEWTCSCPDGSDIRAWSLTRCPLCHSERPERERITDSVRHAQDIMDALEDFDRMSEKYGRAQAMRAVLLKHGRYAS